MQKIKSITLRNFKFFYGHEEQQKQNKIVLNRKNLLLYGENGSGKSSIYWALYTFLQSCLKKDDEQIYKYFKFDSPENLRNRFAEDSEESAIRIKFEDELRVSEIREINNNLINTKQGTFIKKTLDSSDFINYKFLSKLYDFKNSEEIDLFPLFEQEVLMFIDFEEEFTRHDGNLSGTANAGDWWNFIETSPQNLPYNGNVVLVGSTEYKRFKNTTIPRFVELLKSFLLKITEKANKYLKNDFKENYSITFDTDSIECDYNKSVSQRAKDGIIHKPKIPLKIQFEHENLSSDKKTVLKPHTFLNEARLTAIALAIRLAILDEKPKFDGSARILVLDDLLLSFDMTHRDIVLEIILQKASDYQLLIFTHDRGFYNLCKKRIEAKFKEDWLFKEMYITIDENTKIPKPFIPDSKNYMDLGEKYFQEFDYPACVNYLRKECERILAKKLLPKNLTITVTEEQGSKQLNLEMLIKNFNDFYKSIGGNLEPFEKLIEYKDLLLNPLSHDNVDSPIYVKEIESIKSILKDMNKLESKVIALADPDDEKELILTENDINNNEWEYKFTLKENLRAIKDLSGNWLINDPKCCFLQRKNVTLNNQVENIPENFKNLKLNDGYDKIRHNLNLKEKQDKKWVNIKPPNDLKDIIKYDRKSLIDILNE